MLTVRRLALVGALAGSLFSPLVLAQTISGPTVADAGANLFKPSAGPLDPANRLRLSVPADQRPPILREALVEVLVDVDASGKVDDVDVIDGSFLDSAVRRLVETSVKQMTFNPATQGGNAVAFKDLHLQVLLRGANPPGVTDAMRQELVELAAKIEADDFKGAERQINNLLERDAARLFEMAVLQDQLVSIYMETERLPEALLASRIATQRSPVVRPEGEAPPEASFPDTFLSPELHVEALRKRLMLALVNNQVGEALQVFEELQSAAAATGKSDSIANLSEQIQRVKELLASEEPVGSAVYLINGEWSYTMSPRRIFGVTGLEGQVDAIDVSCGDALRRLPFQNDSEWRIPDSWGQCDLIFRGKKGSKFLLYEYLN